MLKIVIEFAGGGKFGRILGRKASAGHQGVKNAHRRHGRVRKQIGVRQPQPLDQQVKLADAAGLLAQPPFRGVAIAGAKPPAHFVKRACQRFHRDHVTRRHTDHLHRCGSAGGGRCQKAGLAKRQLFPQPGLVPVIGFQPRK